MFLPKIKKGYGNACWGKCVTNVIVLKFILVKHSYYWV